MSVPTTLSDHLWDDFLRNDPKIKEYFGSLDDAQRSPSKKKRKGTRNEDEEGIEIFVSKFRFEILTCINKTTTGEYSTIQTSPEESFNFEKVEQAKLRKKMGIVRGRWDKSLQKWVRFYDVYDFPAAEDKFKKRMTLNQFLQKCRDKKKRLEEVESNSQNVRENIEEGEKNLNSNNRGKEKRKHVEDVQFEPKKSRGTMTDISDSELQRINRVRQFASRLNARRKMAFETLASTSKNTESHRGVSLLKRINENDTDDEEDQRIVKPRSKPKIKSIEILEKGTFIRHKR